MNFPCYRVWFMGVDLDLLSACREWCCRESGLHFFLYGPS